MNAETSQKQPKKQGWLWWTMGIITFFFIIIIFSNNNKTAVPLVNDSPINVNQNPPTNIQVTPPTPSKQPLTCTNFEYSDWSTCNVDGEQYRSIITMLPAGCSGGNPTQSQKCKYVPLPQGTTGEKIYQRMINQIKSAPNQTISTNYVAGADAGNTTNLTWQVKDDGLYLYVKAYRTSNPEDQSTMAQVDTNFDGQPEWISDRGQPFVAISSSDQYYKEIILSWATFNAYFVSYLLK